ncbi:Ger(x)C family spore germination protein [Halobacillus kuroshimensis]|uniref:Ger(x)C family spore germination protein n=1 Tax=Halobacillus kuroshimensis TaxID=302481 RepID=UPI0003F55FDE|nr:Ger(x)C family spore germination protein [Halobacillus kuroshimensis]
MNIPTMRAVVSAMICLAMLTGCWNSRELDELGIAVATGIDKNDQGEYLITVQVINPSEVATEAPTTRPPVSTYTITGETLFEAFRKLSIKTPRKIYLSQMRLVVIGESLAEDGIMPALDFLYRDHEFRPSYYITVAKNASVENILSVLTPYEKIPANKVMNSIENAESHWGVTTGVHIDTLISKIRSPGEEAVLGGLLLNGEEDVGNRMSNVEQADAPTTLELDETAVFKEDRLAGWLTEKQSLGFNFITGEVSSTIVTHPCENGETSSVELLRSTSSISAEMDGDTPSISVLIEAEGNIGEMNCDISIGEPEGIDQINLALEEEIETIVQSAIVAAQSDFESDIFGFGQAVHRYEKNDWKTLESEWDEVFKDVRVQVDVKAEVRSRGNSSRQIDKKG